MYIWQDSVPLFSWLKINENRRGVRVSHTGLQHKIDRFPQCVNDLFFKNK